MYCVPPRPKQAKENLDQDHIYDCIDLRENYYIGFCTIKGGKYNFLVLSSTGFHLVANHMSNFEFKQVFEKKNF